jgi:Tol biopolymer transport system component
MCTPFKDDPRAQATGGDAGPSCDANAPFGAPSLVPGLDPGALMAASVEGVRLSPDGLTAYFSATGRPGGVGYGDLYQAERAAVTAPFGSVVPIAGTGIDTPDDESDPTMTGDGLTLLFSRTRPATNPNVFYEANRPTPGIPFTGVTSVFADATALGISDMATPFFREDGAALYFVFVPTQAPDSLTDIYRAPRTNGSLGVPSAVEELNTTFAEIAPVVTPDELTIYFASDRSDGQARGEYDIWTATRSDVGGAFSPPANVAEVNTPSSDVPTFITHDGCTLYLWSDRGGSVAAYVATRGGT